MTPVVCGPENLSDLNTTNNIAGGGWAGGTHLLYVAPGEGESGDILRGENLLVELNIVLQQRDKLWLVSQNNLQYSDWLYPC